MRSLLTRLRRLDGWLPALAWLFALGFAAWAGASLFWQFAAPATVTAEPRLEADPRAAARDIVRSLGGLRSAEASAASTPVAANYRLIGLATGFGDKPGFALLQTDGGETLVLLQDEALADGLRLRRILADRVELADGPRTLELRLVAADGAASPPAPAIEASPRHAPPPHAPDSTD